MWTKQTPRVWYETVSKFLNLEITSQELQLTKPLSLKRLNDLVLLQVYVDDIIFDSTNKK